MYNIIYSYAIHDLECVRTQTLQTCGLEEAADFRYNYEMENLLPTLMLIECDLYPTGKKIVIHIHQITVGFREGGGWRGGQLQTFSNHI